MSIIKLNPEELKSLQQDLFSRRMSIEEDYQILRQKINQLFHFYPEIENHKASTDLERVMEKLNDFMDKAMGIESLLHKTASSFKETEEVLIKRSTASGEK